MRPKRTYRKEKLAKLYDDEILPIWSQRFGRMLLRDLTVPPKAMVLDVGCGTGYPALQIMRRLGEQGRIIAIDSSSAMLDVAREKAGSLAGKRIFFRTEWVEPRLTFADDVYDLVISNLGLPEMIDPASALREFARVAKPGGRVIATLPLAGTFAEFFDVFRDVLLRKKETEALARLEAWLAVQPTEETVRRWFTGAGLRDVHIETERFNLLFQSSREFFFAPLIEYCYLESWKEIVGRGPTLHDIFWNLKESIDAYFRGSSFAVTVVAGCAYAHKATVDDVSDEVSTQDEGEAGRTKFGAGTLSDLEDTDGQGHLLDEE